MSLSSKKLTILITTYNRFSILENCLNAIQNISWPLPIEIVVSDDGSDSETQNKLKLLSINTLLLSEENQGLPTNLNKGIRACKSDYILYIQEDFIINPDLINILKESFDLIDSGKLDMIRYTANYRFNHLIPLNKNINLIPKFSWKNFHLNFFQYSDNPFLTTPSFFENYGCFLNNVSGDYGEMEYAIRIFKSQARIGISSRYYFGHNKYIPSVKEQSSNKKSKILVRNKFNKQTKRTLRSLRLYIEWLFYKPSKRRLVTYHNRRKS